MKRKVLNIILLILTLSFFFRINAFAASFKSEADANAYCKKLVSTASAPLRSSKCTNDLNCQYVGNECIAKTCNMINSDDCSNYSWCTPYSPNKSVGCYNKMTCKEYANLGKYVNKDDFGNTCQNSGNHDPLILLDKFSGKKDDTADLCKMLDEYSDYYNGKNPFAGYDCATLPNNVKSACYEFKNSGISNIYDTMCRCSNDCKDGTICVGNNTCECPIGTTVVNGKCVKTGSGGSKGKACSENYDFVKNALTTNCDSNGDLSCKAADCDIVSTTTLKSNVTIPGIYYYNNGVATEYKANRYAGTCHNLGVDTYCIDPASQFSASGYSCQSALNAKSATDQGYIKIYQSSLSKYKDQYLNDSTDDDKYMAMHFAFRLYTYYKDLGQNTKIHPKALYFSKTSKALFSGNQINEVKNGDGYFFIKNNLFASVERTNSDEYKVYRDAVNLFKEAISTYNVWESPLKFTKVSSNVNDSGTMVAKIKLSGLDEIRNSEFNDKLVTNVTCENCRINTALNSNLLSYQSDSVEFDVSIIDPTQEYTISVKYYDKRDAKNIVVATLNKNASYQRLLLVTREARQFTYDETFNNELMGCRVTPNGKLYGGNDNNSLSVTEFTNKCCKDLGYDENLRIAFLRVIAGKKDYAYMTEEWIHNNCNNPCNPQNDTNKCTTNDGDTKVITIGDFVKGETAGLNYNGVNHLCSKNGVDNQGNSYNIISNNYCKVYCYEEYQFTVPTYLGHRDIDVNKNGYDYGRYFEINVPSKGTRTCYTDPESSIDYNGFLTDYNSKKTTFDNNLSLLNDWNNAVANFNESAVTKENKACTKPGTGAKCESYPGVSDDGSRCHHTKQSSENCRDGYTSTDGVNCYKGYNEGSTDTSCGNYDSYSYSVNIGGTAVTITSGTCDTSACTSKSGSASDIKTQITTKRNEQYTETNKALSELNSVINSYNSCSTFSADIDYNPRIKYEYQEDAYMKKLGNNNYLQTIDLDKVEREETNNYYTNLYNEIEYSGNGTTDQTVNVVTYNCDSNSKTCSNTTAIIHNNKYVHKKVTASSTLYPVTEWYTQPGNGIANPYKFENGLYIGRVLPITRICKEKTYFPYTLEVTNIGIPKNNGVGRLDKVIANNTFAAANTNLKYECTYSLSSHCDGCETTFYYRAISLNDVFTKGMNDYSPKKDVSGQRNIEGVWIKEKGKETQKEIETKGENAYQAKNLEYSYTLTPTGMQHIREYNRTRLTDGFNLGYGDFNLECPEGKHCISNFLNEIDDGKYRGVTRNARNEVFEEYKDGTPWK